MKLTRSDRIAFVNAVMNDVPEVNYAGQAKKILEQHVVEQLPPQIKAIYQDDRLRRYIETSGIQLPHFDTYVYVVGAEHVERKVAVDASSDAIAPLYAAYCEQRDARLRLRDRVTQLINGCTTLAQAKARLPEFEKYLPADRDKQNTPNLPIVTNVVEELKEAGWPKGKQPQQTTQP